MRKSSTGLETCGVGLSREFCVRNGTIDSPQWLLSAKCGSSAPRWHHHNAVLNAVALTFSISGGARRRPLHAVVRVRFRPLEPLVP